MSTVLTLAEPASQPCTREECDICQEGGPETFWYMQHRYLFDVDHARALVCERRESVEVDEESVRQSVRTSDIHDYHVPHVDPSFPGIIAHIRFREENGEEVKGHVLIDGHHRAARCLQLERPFSAYLLTEEESEQVLIRNPNAAA